MHGTPNITIPRPSRHGVIFLFIEGPAITGVTCMLVIGLGLLFLSWILSLASSERVYRYRGATTSHQNCSTVGRVRARQDKASAIVCPVVVEASLRMAPRLPNAALIILPILTDKVKTFAGKRTCPTLRGSGRPSLRTCFLKHLLLRDAGARTFLVPKRAPNLKRKSVCRSQKPAD